jgi:hypothetical protein
VRLEHALARFDEVNAEDPRGQELIYGHRMSACLERLVPDASGPLRLAARAQHIARWRIERADYPEGRAGYKRWRSDCARLHAEVAGAILGELGYDEPVIARVRDLLSKKGLAHDPEVQALEDVACLVFLEHYFADFARKHERDKLVDIVRKTWKKMSDRGRAAARGLSLPSELAAIVSDAIR